VNWWPFISRARYDTDIAAAHAETNRIRAERDDARAERRAFRAAATTGAEQVIDVSIVNDCLTRDLLLSRRQRVIARKAAARILVAWSAEKRRADHLQQRYDAAVGLNTPAIAAGDSWQERREQRMRFDQPTTTKETTP
jgi:hypothetical protein